jgi:hypothetical protein
LPYHAKKHLQLPYTATKSSCGHSLSKHEEVTDPNGKKVTFSYALQCNVSHKATTKNPVHKDVTRRTW